MVSELLIPTYRFIDPFLRKCEWGECPDEVRYPRVFCERHKDRVLEILWYPTQKGERESGIRS